MVKNGVMYADDGIEIKIGDRLVSECGYEVIVYADENLELVGKLVCEPGHSCEDIPYSLNNGDGHKHMHYSNTVKAEEGPEEVKWTNFDSLKCYETTIKELNNKISDIQAAIFETEKLKCELAYKWIKKNHPEWLEHCMANDDNYYQYIEVSINKDNDICIDIECEVDDIAWEGHKVKIDEFNETN